MVTKKPLAKKTVAKKPAARKAPAHKPVVKKAAPVASTPAVVETAAAVEVNFAKPSLGKGKYVFATGRRKTAIANVRLFSGSEDSLVNKKTLANYFGQSALSETALRPLAVTGLQGDFYFIAHAGGGGITAQSEAIRHGIAQALASLSDELKTVLKKNGFLTRDDRKKERKKPGLRRARRAPQWAKR